MRLLLALGLLAWVLLGGGAGCGQSWEPVVLTCPSDRSHVHWGYVCRTSLDCDTVAQASVWDCEWNGLDDAGPLDGDSQDPTDPRIHWDYLLTDSGQLCADTFVRDAGLLGEMRIDGTTIMWGSFEAVSGTRYRLVIDREATPDADANAVVRVTCDGVTLLDWSSHDGEASAMPPEPWTADAAASCLVQTVSVCSQHAGDPEAVCSDMFRVERAL